MSHFQIPIFSTLVGWLADMMAWAVQFFYNLTASLGFPSYGIAIIILTIVIKVLLLPFALKQIWAIFPRISGCSTSSPWPSSWTIWPP